MAFVLILDNLLVMRLDLVSTQKSASETDAVAKTQLGIVDDDACFRPSPSSSS